MSAEWGEIQSYPSTSWLNMCLPLERCRCPFEFLSLYGQASKLLSNHRLFNGKLQLWCICSFAWCSWIVMMLLDMKPQFNSVSRGFGASCKSQVRQTDGMAIIPTLRIVLTFFVPIFDTRFVAQLNDYVRLWDRVSYVFVSGTNQFVLLADLIQLNEFITLIDRLQM